MPDSGIQPPYLDPSQYPAYIDLQRKQMLAQALMQNSQQSAQNPQDWNSMRIVPRRSALSNVATLASGLMAGKANNAALGAQQNYFQGMMGGAPAPAPQAPSASPPSPGLQPPNGVAGSQGPPGPTPGGPPAGAAPPAGLLPPQSQAPNPMIIPGMSRQQAQAALTMAGPQEYGKALMSQYAPTDMEKTLRAAGIDPASGLGRQILQQTVAKQNYIAPIEEREGSVQRDPLTNAVIGVNPKTTTGGLNLYDNQGRYSGQAMAPGAADTIRESEKATALGQTEGKYSILPTAGGGTTVVGGPRANQPAGAAPPPASAPSAPRAPAAPAAPATPWDSMPKLPVSSAIGAPDAFTHGRLVAAGSKDAELSSQYGKEADLADQKLQYNNESRKALSTAEVGPASEWLTEHRANLKEWGVPDSLIPGNATITPTMELNKNLKQSALQGARQTFGTRMTQMEVKLQHDELSPSTSMTRDAISSLLHQDDIKQMYAKQRSEDYGKYIQGKGDPMRFESWYSKNFPLTKFAQQQEPAAPQSSASAQAKFSADEIATEMKRRGLR